MDELFTQLFNEYYDDVFRLSYSYSLNIQDAEDITQRTFVKLYKHINKFNDDHDYVKRWLFIVAINDTKSLLKSSWKKKNIYTDEYENFGYKFNDNFDLIISLNKISKKYRIPLFLYYYEGYSIDEISTLMNIKNSTIKSILKRGREKLKIELEIGENVK